jgi:hypothetical protein
MNNAEKLKAKFRKNVATSIKKDCQDRGEFA